MCFAGRIFKDDKFWLAEIPLLDAMTQSRTRKEAFAMVADLLETLANRPGFSVHVHPGKHEAFEVSPTATGTQRVVFSRSRSALGCQVPQCVCAVRARDLCTDAGQTDGVAASG